MTHKRNGISADINFRLFTTSKMTNKNNLLYLKMFGRGYQLNPRPVKGHQIKDGKFEVFNNKGLHFMHLNSNSLLLKID